MTQPIVQHFFDEPTNTFSYVVRDPDSQACAILDSVLDFDYAAGRTDVRSADEIIQYVRDNNLTVEWILRSEEHTSELQSRPHLVCRLLLEKKKQIEINAHPDAAARQISVAHA